ncbi:hypothetical protein KP509_05G014400 [Ceratopteris richardii]|uniref:Glycosyltransferase n=2 Tax=Ceratopteris richardii TaxID=49495 RepID=A0A8T2UP05_CERRI|nr:hypothetical protein KP509_05G014400 [Ceratopteris richardii]
MATHTTEGERYLHVLAVPFPAQGHLTPLMRFCKLLLKHYQNRGSLRVTFLDFYPPNDSADHSFSFKFHHDRLLQRVRFPFPNFSQQLPSLQTFFDSLLCIESGLHQLIQFFNCHGLPVTCLVTDFMTTFPTQDVADKLGISRIALFTLSASRLLLINYASQNDTFSIEQVMDAINSTERRDEVFCDSVPGLPRLLNKDLPQFKHITDDTRTVWEFANRSWKACNSRAHAVVLNTFEELEPSACGLLSDDCDVPVYDVGLWIESLSGDTSTSMREEDERCIGWLDQQPTSSVLYISFGSTTMLSKGQFEALLHGVIDSKQRFLWVLRPGLIDDIDYCSASKEIISRSENRGFVVDWAPQLRVLSHSSVGGFLSHCGWNSTIESIANGVPILCWPYFADQHMNARFIVDEWRMGLQFKHTGEGGYLVESYEIETAIRSLMEGKEGSILRKNAHALKQKSSQCFESSGSSLLKLDALIKDMETSIQCGTVSSSSCKS